MQINKVRVTNVLVVAAALLLGRCSVNPEPPSVITSVKEVAPKALLDSVADLRLEAEGLRNRLAGRTVLPPVVILKTDTLVSPPDTVLVALSLSGRGELSLAPLHRVDSLWAPEIHRYDVSACDDGFSWAAGELVCDRPRFGHLSPFASVGAAYDGAVGATVALGASWAPSNRSVWSVSAEIDATKRIGIEFIREWSAW